jgi:hypothetical protein
MHKILGKFVLGTSALALALSGSSAMADAISTVTATPVSSTPISMGTQEYYSTSGSIGTTGLSNSNNDTTLGPVGFTALPSGNFGLNSAISLGSFTVSALSDGSTWTYNNTPFTINYNPVSVGGTNFGTNHPITVTGVLNGQVTGTTSDVVATFNNLAAPAFSTPDGTYVGNLTIPNNPLALVAASAGGSTTIQGALVTTTSSPSPAGTGSTQTPEPTTLAILATSILGLGLRQRLRSGRKSA